MIDLCRRLRRWNEAIQTSVLRLMAALVYEDVCLQSSVNEPSYLCRCSTVTGARLLLVVGLVPTLCDFTFLSKNMPEKGSADLTLLRLFACRCPDPEMVDRMDIDEECRKQILDDEEMLKEERLFRREKQRWQRLLLGRCVDRIVDIALIFNQLPTLIIVEICLYDRKCLKQIESAMIWDVVINVLHRTRR